MSVQPLNVLVIGAGMYVCGSGTDSFGTILPTLVQEQHLGKLGKIHVSATRPESITQLQEKLAALNRLMGTKTHIQGYPTKGTRDTQAYKKALEIVPRPAAAVISVPDHLHASITRDVIKAGIPPLVVKPLTPTVPEALDLIQLLDQYQLYGAVEFHKRFDQANLLLRQKIRDGKLGDLCYVVVEYSQRRLIREIFHSWVSQTNIFQYLGVHYADLVYFVTGARPLRVLATGQGNSRPASTKENPVYDAIQVVVEWEIPPQGKRFISTILTNWIDPNTTSAMSDQKITVAGTNGRYQSDQKHRGVQMVTEEGGLEDINPYFTQFYQDSETPLQTGVHGYGPASIRCFLRDVERLFAGTVSRQELMNHRPSFWQALPSTAVVEAVNRSLAQDSQWVSIDKQGRIEN
ncbi:MAG: Gfo/Idh/MocA family oxidoreductase [Candidatus Aminicenantes bacterium]|jgi:predicted dehydrogenase